MFEYTSAYLSPFSWAKAAYDSEFNLRQPKNGMVNVSAGELTKPASNYLDFFLISIKTAQDWNLYSKEFIGTISSLNKSIDQAQGYLDSIYNLTEARYKESEERVRLLENKLKAALGNRQRTSSLELSLIGGDSTYLDFDSKFYSKYPPLKVDSDEFVFKLRDGGFFSSIRSLGGYAGSIFIEKRLLNYSEVGILNNLTDGSRNSFWVAEASSPAPVKSNSTQVPWLPESYQYGFALMLSYYIDRPTLISEVFIDPVITEPLDLLSISWQPANLTNLIPSLFSSSGWVSSGLGSFVLGGSVNPSSLFINLSTSGLGWAQHTFKIPTVTVGASGTQFKLSNRAQLSYLMRGLGDVKAGARIYWIDSGGNILNYNRSDETPTSYWSNWGMIDYIPSGAVSGIVQLGVFNTTQAPASVFIDNPQLIIGDEIFNCNLELTGPTTVQLPKAILSNRVSLIFSQRNTRRTRTSTPELLDSFTYEAQDDLDQALQNLVKRTISKNKMGDAGNNTFSYRIGFKEVDLRYREHVPRGKLVSQPLNTRKEIRELWVNAELSKFYNSGLEFKILPYEADLGKEITIKPWRISNSFYNTLSDGDTLRVFSAEEFEAGWASEADLIMVAPEKTLVENYNGTDFSGRLLLNSAPHLRRVALKKNLSWLRQYSPWPALFDPNAAQLYGFGSEALKEAIRSNAIPSGLELSDIQTTVGYQPIKVTVKTDRWVAYPDTFGKPEASKIRRVSGEILTDISNLTETQVTETSTDSISFDAWLSTTKGKALWDFLGNRITSYGITSGNLQLRLSVAADSTLSQIIAQSFPRGDEYKNQLKACYDKLRAEGKLALNSSQNTTTVSVIPENSIYATKNTPILGGKNSSSLKLFWLNPSPSGGLLPIPRADFEVIDYKLGKIKVLKQAPSGYTQVQADYLYFNANGNEDFFSTIISSINTASSSVSGINSELDFRGRSFPITRNMTDYVTGKVPNLRAPNFTRLSKEYYPIIEYYLTPDGELVFSRDFHPFGDIPATITVEYDTLGIIPRVVLEVNRSGSSGTTPSVKSITLKAKEASSAPVGT